MMLTLRDRRHEPEWMDQPQLDPTLHREALRGLARLNRVARISGAFWNPLRELAKQISPRPLRVLDLASGAGDLAVALACRAARNRLPLIVHGCDISPVAVRHAQYAAERLALQHVEFFQLDVTRHPLATDYDAITCSLFLHHLSDHQAAELLRKAARATRRLLLVSDLRRSPLGYGLAWAGTRLLTRSPVVHFDGPRSVAAAFSLEQLAQLAASNGLHGARITRHWPQRMLLTWSKP